MKRKWMILSIVLILVLIVFCSFAISFSNDKKIREQREQIQRLVLNYLEDKYKEKFEIKEYYLEKVPYDVSTLSDEVIDSSKLHVFKLISNRLIEFDVIYIEYLDDSVYKSNKVNDIMEPGIYDNYLYEYKRRDIKNELKDNVSQICYNVKSIDVSLTDIGNYYIENLLIRQSLDSKEEIVLYDKYLSLDKMVSNIEFYNLTMDITNGNLILNIDMNDYIVSSDLSDFKEIVVELVKYIEKIGYVQYDINFSFNKYQSARVTKYLTDEKEQIYLIFDYEMYSNEKDDTKLGAYILDK